MTKNFLRVLLLIAVTAWLLCLGALAVSVEQTQVKMPGIDVYLYEDGGELSGLSPEEIKATLDGAPLNVKDLSRSEQGIYYVYMLDVSASIPAAHFNAAVDAVANSLSRLRPQDKMALITFGNEVTLLLDGDESPDRALDALSQLNNSDNNTAFYNAMDELIGLVVKTEGMRRVAVVISDGIDDTEAGMTQEELEEKLLRSGVSVSAMCIDSSSPETVVKFRDFIHVSGGELYLFGAADARAVLDSLLGRLEGGWLLRLEAQNNIARGNKAKLIIDLGEAALIKCDVSLDDWVPDETRPRVTETAYDPEAGILTVFFSEAVSGADSLSAYTLTDDRGNALPIRGVELGEGGSCRLWIEPGTMPEEGNVTLSVSGLKDVSMEENEMYKFSGIVYTAAPKVADGAVETAPENTETGLDPEVKTLIVFGAAGVILALVLAAVIVISVRGGRKAEKPKKKMEKKKKDKDKREGSSAKFIFMDGDNNKLS